MKWGLMKSFKLVFLTILCFASYAHSSYQVLISEQVIEESDERKARRVAIDQATDMVTVEMVKKELGQDRFNENKSKIEKEVKPFKNRFIPFFKILTSNKEGDSYRFKIEVKVSTEDLKLVLQQRGLFASLAKTGITLPFIEFNNQLSGEAVRWWSPVFTVSKDLENLSLVFETELFQGFLDKGLFMLRPQAFHMENLLPSFLRKTYLTQSEMNQITQVKNGQLFLDGRVDVLSSPIRENAYRMRVQISCKQTHNGKTVAEIVRTLDSATGKQINQMTTEIKQMAEEAGQDLAGQVYDLWQRGALESSVLQLVINGDLNQQQLSRFKKELSTKIGITEGLTERLFEPGKVTFEMDYNGGVDSLSAKLSKSRFDGFISQVVSTQADQIIMDVKASQ
jgi:hypothetical protein